MATIAKALASSSTPILNQEKAASLVVPDQANQRPSLKRFSSFPPTNDSDESFIQEPSSSLEVAELTETTVNTETSDEAIVELSSSNSTQFDSLPTNTFLPSVVFLIPFPEPVNATRSKKTTPFLIYSLPRRPYQKPKKNENGEKRPKEKLSKRLVRIYQKEVQFGEQLKRKEIPNVGKFAKLKKFRGACIRGASTLTKWLPTSCVETLSRLPPKRKLGEILVLYPTNFGGPSADGSEKSQQPSVEDLRNDLYSLFRRTKKRVLIRLVAVTCFLPIAAGIDFFAPVFFVEISLAYLAFQIYGFRKVKAITAKRKKAKKPKNKKSTPGKFQLKNQQAVEEVQPDNENVPLITTTQVDEAQPDNENTPLMATAESQEGVSITFQETDDIIFEAIRPLLYKICSRIDPLTFPPPESIQTTTANSLEEVAPEASVEEGQVVPATRSRTTLPPSLHKPGPEVVRELLAAFKEHVPEEIQERYNLNEDRISEDLSRYLKKASVEYIDSLKGRPERGFVKVMKKWFTKRSLIRKERKEKQRIKKQIKAEEAEEAALAEAITVEQDSSTATVDETNVVGGTDLL
ncbi:hypothetical protein O181_018544 [Austropuccinia psidii MF-1]|uniref:Uncharacterized protein n=1 Tax=Austropuccinia psidii MF-1 TaxID=1389203 RepID=A0A9Q3C5G9_9BASI|nr:hypothetical protein [Austropuccinia psidii MF-1]